MTITPLNGTYTGQAQKLVSVSNIPDGVTITYSLDNAAYSEEIPEKTDAGEYTVYYKASGSGYNDASGSVTAVIAGTT
jgi:hypothetical protein